MNGLMMDYQLTITKILSRFRQFYAHCKIVSRLSSFEQHVYTYGECYNRICKLANVLKKLGVKQGDRIGTFAWNHYQHLELYYAVPCSGAILHTINMRLSPDQLVYVINHAEDQVIFVDATLLPLLEKVAPELNTVKHYIVMGAEADVKTSLPSVSYYEQLLEEESSSFNWPDLEENTAAGLCYTSGTTGDPKGVLYSHRSQYIHSISGVVKDWLGVSIADVVLSLVPMFHANAWGLPYSCAMIGAQQILPGPNLKPEDIARIITNEKVTLAAGVPTLWVGLYEYAKKNSKDIDLSSLRTILVGGAAMPQELMKAYELDLGVRVIHAWGMTETSPMGTCSSQVDHWGTQISEEHYAFKGCQGIAAPGLEIRIVDDSGKELPWNGTAVGEIQVRGPWVASSYFKGDELINKQFTSDGWFSTGDIASMSSKGLLRITDRSKDLVKSGGEWISSVDLENILMSHNKVLEAAVIAIPNEKWGERPLAIVVQRLGDTASAEELTAYLAGKVSKFWLPDEIRFVESIPKTSVGKFDKKKLRQMHENKQL